MPAFRAYKHGQEQMRSLHNCREELRSEVKDWYDKNKALGVKLKKPEVYGLTSEGEIPPLSPRSKRQGWIWTREGDDDSVPCASSKDYDEEAGFLSYQELGWEKRPSQGEKQPTPKEARELQAAKEGSASEAEEEPSGPDTDPEN